MWFYPFPNWPEEPAFSRRRPRFSGSVQPAAGSSPAVIRCEPTSGIPVTAALRFHPPHWFAVFAPRRSSSEKSRVGRVCFRLHPVKSDCEEANQDAFHLFGAFSRPEALQPRAVSQVPARTTTHDQPLQSRLNALLRRARDLQPRTLSPSSPSHYLFSRRPFGFGFDGGVSDPNARSRRRPTERAGRHLEPDARPNDFCNCIQRTDASTSG